MSKVTRYDYALKGTQDDEYVEMCEDKDGEYVLYSDYAKLEERLNELEAKHRWVPVSEALPDKNTDCLVTDGFACMVSEYLGAGKWNFWELTWWEYEDVTHWRRIDAPEQAGLDEMSGE